MAKPAILLVDDDVQVLNSVERDLRAHFRGDYRLVKAISGQEALDAARQLKRLNEKMPKVKMHTNKKHAGKANAISGFNMPIVPIMDVLNDKKAKKSRKMRLL